MSTPTADESAAFRAHAVENLAGAIRQAIAASVSDSTGAHSVDQLYSFHKALRDALPHADSLLIPPTSILRPAPDPRTTAFTDRLKNTFASFINSDHERIDAVNNVNIVVPGFVGALIELGSDKHESVLSALANYSTALAAPPELDRLRFSAAASAALGIIKIGQNEAAGVAWGQTPISRPRILSTLGRPERQSGVEIARRAANIDSTLVRLRDLRDLALLIGSSADARKKLGVAPAEIRSFVNALEPLSIDAANVRAQLGQIGHGLDQMDASIARLAGEVSSLDLSRIGVIGTSSHAYQTRAQWYVSQDLGFLYVTHGRQVHDATGYFGGNLYLRPVNKDAPLGGWCFIASMQCLLRRLSFTLGVTTGKLEVQDRYSGPLGGRAVYTAVGFRVGDFFRVNYGAPLVYTYTPDSERRRRLSAFSGVGASIDFQLKDLIGNVVSAFSP